MWGLEALIMRREFTIRTEKADKQINNKQKFLPRKGKCGRKITITTTDTGAWGSVVVKALRY
jgi:hypothetical protein